ncbi:hypothetical protein GCM10010302_02520 [Streptomyces polychromogenes]|uniref:HTH luxR-type domain-containing protein n=1 Tax=Streptomyces polychromogenes TaxID=67342 RepID=A0ABN0UZX0_9ACTN
MKTNQQDIVRAVYSRALADADWHPHEVIEQFGWNRAEYDEAVRVLTDLHLIVPSSSTPSGWYALSPETAEYQLLRQTSRLALEALDEAARAQETIKGLRDHLPRLQESPSGFQVQTIVGAANIGAALEDAAHGARRRVLSMHPGRPLPASMVNDGLERDARVLSRGIELRTIHMASTAAVPHMTNYLRRLSAIGGQVRTLHTLPLRMIIIDDDLAFVPAPTAASDGVGDNSSALLIRDRRIVRILELLYEHSWDRGLQLLPMAEAAEESSGADAEPWQPTGRHQELLRLLSAGSTDDVISRRLGVSERTVRRLVAELLEQLGADSRFQAGVNAVRKGWL